MNTSQQIYTYPATLSEMMQDLNVNHGYMAHDIKESAEFLKGKEIHIWDSVTATLRNRVLELLENNGAPKIH